MSAVNNHLQNNLVDVPNANFAQIGAAQMKCWCKLNCQTLQKKTYVVNETA